MVFKGLKEGEKEEKKDWIVYSTCKYISVLTIERRWVDHTSLKFYFKTSLSGKEISPTL